jgi:hypothetical protein
MEGAGNRTSIRTKEKLKNKHRMGGKRSKRKREQRDKREMGKAGSKRRIMEKDKS